MVAGPQSSRHWFQALLLKEGVKKRNTPGSHFQRRGWNLSEIWIMDVWRQLLRSIVPIFSCQKDDPRYDDEGEEADDTEQCMKIDETDVDAARRCHWTKKNALAPWQETPNPCTTSFWCLIDEIRTCCWLRKLQNVWVLNSQLSRPKHMVAPPKNSTTQKWVVARTFLLNFSVATGTRSD